MIARTHAVAGPGATLRELCCEPPLTIRQVRTDEPGVCALRLVGTAAGPLPGDELSLRLDVLPDARTVVAAAGAQLAQGRNGAVAQLRTDLAVGSRASLRGDTGALIVATGATVDVHVGLDHAADASVEWHELVVLGRSGEAPGRALLRWAVTCEGRPVLRQHTTLSPDASPWLLDGNRVLATAYLAGPDLSARTVVLHRHAVATRIGEHAALITVLSTDTARAAADLGELRATLLNRASPSP